LIPRLEISRTIHGLIYGKRTDLRDAMRYVPIDELVLAVYLRLGTGIAQEKEDRSETLSCARTWLVSLVEAHLSDFIALLVCSSFHCVVSYV
jgi:hypothetical protein